MIRRTILPVLATTLIAAATGCASPGSLQSTLSEHPEILAQAMEEHPEKFSQAFMKIDAAARKMLVEQREHESEQRREQELKNPLHPELPADRAYYGPADAPIQIVEYSDFQCPFCQRGYETLQEVFRAYPGQVRFLYKEHPLPMHPLALPAAKRFEAIALQSAGKAYQFQDEVFQHQARLSQEGEKYLDDVARGLKVNMARMKKDMDSPAVAQRIMADADEAEKFGFNGTPAFVVNGVSVVGALPFSEFREIIERKLHPTAMPASAPTG